MAAAQMSNAQLLVSAIGEQGILYNVARALMVDPVQLPDGITYERTDITNGNIPKYPITNPPLMIPNYTIKNIIDAIQNNDGDELEVALSCPTTLTMFVNPVICSGDGHTFSKNSIEGWLVRDRGAEAVAADFMISPATRVRCGELIANRTLIRFMERMGLQPTSQGAPSATRKVNIQTLIKVASKVLDTRPGAQQYSNETKNFVLLYLQNQVKTAKSPTQIIIMATIDSLRGEHHLNIGPYNPRLHGGYRIYKSKSKINKRNHSRKRKHSRKRG